MRYLRRASIWTAVAVVLAVCGWVVTRAASADPPDYEGTWRLTSRTLVDASSLMPRAGTEEQFCFCSATFEMTVLHLWQGALVSESSVTYTVGEDGALEFSGDGQSIRLYATVSGSELTLTRESHSGDPEIPGGPAAPDIIILERVE